MFGSSHPFAVLQHHPRNRSFQRLDVSFESEAGSRRWAPPPAGGGATGRRRGGCCSCHQHPPHVQSLQHPGRGAGLARTAVRRTAAPRCGPGTRVAESRRPSPHAHLGGGVWCVRCKALVTVVPHATLHSVAYSFTMPTTSLTRANEAMSAARSPSSRGSSMTRSTPPAPMTTGTPR